MIYYPDERRRHSHRSPSELVEDDVRAVLPADFRIIETSGVDRPTPTPTALPAFFQLSQSEKSE